MAASPSSGRSDGCTIRRSLHRRTGTAWRRTLALHVERVGERLRLRLHNNGMASVAETEVRSRSAIGLNNVRERLVHLYGAGHDFDFSLAANGDCTVEISLPFRAMAVAA